MDLQKLHILVIILISFFFCGCFWTKNIEKTDPSKINGSSLSLDKDESDPDDDEDTDSTTDETTNSLSEIFSLKNKIDEIRLQFMEGQPGYALKQAEGVIPMLKPDSKQRLELYFLMARCCEQLGREKDREHHDKAFRDLIEKLGKSDEHKAALAAGKNVQQLIEKSIEKSEPLREKSVFDSDEDFFNLRCFRKLKRADKDEVIEETMDDSGKIFYGKKAKNVIAEASSAIGLAETDIIIHQDPRFDFYYTIIEGAH